MSTLLAAHVFSLGFIASLISLADKEALSWLRGRTRTLDPVRLRQYHRLMWIGLLLLSVTGFFLLYPLRLYLFEEPLFVAKLFFVGVLFINAVLIGRLQHVAAAKPFRELSVKEKLPLFMSGALSAYCWVAAAALGYIVTNW